MACPVYRTLLYLLSEIRHWFLVFVEKWGSRPKRRPNSADTREFNILAMGVFYITWEQRNSWISVEQAFRPLRSRTTGSSVSPSHIFPLFFLCFFSFPFCIFPFFSLTSNFNFSVSKLRNLVIDSSKGLVSFWRAKILMLNSKFPREENSLT